MFMGKGADKVLNLQGTIVYSFFSKFIESAFYHPV